MDLEKRYFQPNQKKHRRFAGIFALLILGILGFYFGPRAVSAFIDETNAVHIDPKSIDDGTLAIGTHLVYLGALNDELYRIAKDSAAESNQHNVYYKSELAKGAWFDITDAGGLSDITANGQVVSDEVIRNLLFTHHTKSDGITYDLKANTPVSVFDVENPYDLSGAKDLQSLEEQRRILEEGGSSDSVRKNLAAIDVFYQTDVRNEETNQMDESLAALQEMYRSLQNDANGQEKRTWLQSVMKKLDNARRVVVANRLEEALSELSDQVSGSGQTEEDSSDPADQGLISAIADARANVLQTQTEAQANVLEDGDKTLTHAMFEAASDLIRAVREKDQTKADALLAKLQAIQAVTEDRLQSGNEKQELSVLEELTEQSKAAFQAVLSRGETTEYKEKKNSGASEGALLAIKNSDLANADAKQSELAFLIGAKAKRLGESDAKAYLQSQIEESAKLKASVNPDDYQSALQSCVDRLSGQLAENLKEVGRSGAIEADSLAGLRQQKEELQTKRLAALDAEDLDTANRIQAEIEATDEKIRAAEQAKTNELNQLQQQKNELQQKIANTQDGKDRLEAQLSEIEGKLAAAQGEADAASKAGNILQQKDAAVKLIDQGATDFPSVEKIKQHIEALGAQAQQGASLAVSAQKELYQKLVAKAYLEDMTAYQSLIKQIEDQIADAPVGIIKGHLSAEDAQKALEEANGGKIDEACVLALAAYAEQNGSDELKSLASGMALSLSGKDNGLIFPRLSQNQILFMPVRILARVKNLRYIWNDSRQEATISGRKGFYRFGAFSSEVQMQKDQTEYMEEAAISKNRELWIEAPYTEKTFGVRISDISGTEYSVVVNDKMLEKVQSLQGALEKKGGN